MRWRTGRRSSNVEDRRGEQTGIRRGRMPMGIGKRGLGGGLGTVVFILVALYFGVDPSVILNTGSVSSSGSSDLGQVTAPRRSAAEEELKDFVSVVLADTEDTWTSLFQAAGKDYQEPHLVLFSGAVQSACGFAQAAMGPFYCPGDYKVYIDLSFYHDLRERFGAPGDFAQAYVIAHEVGHHVQSLLGISDKVQGASRRMSEADANALSVRQELQADCFAGVWANHADRARNIMEAGDVEEALGAAAAIGDDRLQKRSRGYVTPDAFTHGSSEQRVRWFRRGLKQGSLAACDPFSVAQADL